MAEYDALSPSEEQLEAARGLLSALQDRHATFRRDWPLWTGSPESWRALDTPPFERLAWTANHLLRERKVRRDEFNTPFLRHLHIASTSQVMSQDFTADHDTFCFPFPDERLSSIPPDLVDLLQERFRETFRRLISDFLRIYHQYGQTGKGGKDQQGQQKAELREEARELSEKLCEQIGLLRPKRKKVESTPTTLHALHSEARAIVDEVLSWQPSGAVADRLEDALRIDPDRQRAVDVLLELPIFPRGATLLTFSFLLPHEIEALRVEDGTPSEMARRLLAHRIPGRPSPNYLRTLIARGK